MKLALKLYPCCSTSINLILSKGAFVSPRLVEIVYNIKFRSILFSNQKYRMVFATFNTTKICEKHYYLFTMIYESISASIRLFESVIGTFCQLRTICVALYPYPVPTLTEVPDAFQLYKPPNYQSGGCNFHLSSFSLIENKKHKTDKQTKRIIQSCKKFLIHIFSISQTTNSTF